MNHIEICHVKIHNTTLPEAVDYALSGERSPCWVVTPNAVMLDACERTPETARLLSGADLSIPDGAGVLLAAKRQGTPLSCRVAGIEFGEALLARAAEAGLRVFLLGGGEGVAEAAEERLRARYPRLCVCGTCWGYFEKSGEEDRRVTAYVRACRPDILFVCLGFPMQERWIEEHLRLLDGVRVVAGLGGSLDVWSGRLQRAPKPVSRMGLEWAWRMLKEPKRLKNLPAIVRFVLK
jgi:N-acetylglucosaminyldiphosphoundecaprenol N-acetyl-beta-D-mannosaminyltransferase